MLNAFSGFVSSFWVIFSLSFLIALTGAMSPGPLLTYTIIKTIKTRRYPYLTGLWIILGHAVIEIVIIVLLLMGYSFLINSVAVKKLIGISGGIILILFGLSIIKNIFQGKISTDFLKEPERPENEAGNLIEKSIGNPVLGGAIVSMSNPYWWIWWATFGFAFMVQYDVTMKQWSNLAAFFLGHEAGDLLWYFFISILVYIGLKRINRKIYYGILICCGLFMIVFGMYLGISAFV